MENDIRWSLATSCRHRDPVVKNLVLSQEAPIRSRAERRSTRAISAPCPFRHVCCRASLLPCPCLAAPVAAGQEGLRPRAAAQVPPVARVEVAAQLEAAV